MSEETPQEIQEETPEKMEEASAEPVEEEAKEAPLVKKRGRPPGAKNKPKTKIIETPVAGASVGRDGTDGSFKTPAPATPVIMKAPEPRMFTHEEVQSLLLDSCRLQEQRVREEKRERYSAFFRRQKWTQS